MLSRLGAAGYDTEIKIFQSSTELPPFVALNDPEILLYHSPFFRKEAPDYTVKSTRI